MPIINQEGWDKSVANNPDPYGKCCVDVARRVMEILDATPVDQPVGDASDLITQADNDIKAGGITGFMAGCVANMVFHCHSRGKEFGKSWNSSWGVEEKPGEEPKGVVNPAIITIGVSDQPPAEPIGENTRAAMEAAANVLQANSSSDAGEAYRGLRKALDQKGGSET